MNKPLKSFERQNRSEVLVLDDWVLPKDFRFVHFGHSSCYFLPVSGPRDIVQNGRRLMEGHSYLYFFDEFDAVEIHVVLCILFN